MSKFFLKIGIGLLLVAGVTRSSVAASPPAMPAGGWPTNLSLLNGTSPNGTWALFVRDHKPVDTGAISNGWYLTLTTANPVGFAADNALYSAPTNVPLVTGSSWDVTLAITNYGPSISSNVVVSDSLPAVLSLTATNASLGTVTNNGSTLVWNLGNLPVNTGATLTLRFLASAVGGYTNTAVVSSATSDPNPDEDMAIATASVTASVPPTLSAPTISSTGGFQFSVSGNAGSSTIVQTSTNLVNWLNVYTNISPFTYTNLNPASFSSLFYRALVGP